jgi:glycosyltransferase involved in cell wall biosynthesis
MAEYYRAADMFFVPTAEDGLGIAALEAMACACPVVGLRSNQLRHLVIDGETGLLARPNAANALVQALERLLANSALRKRMGQRAAAWVQESFNLYAIGKLWDNLYWEIVHRYGRATGCQLSREQEIC